MTQINTPAGVSTDSSIFPLMLISDMTSDRLLRLALHHETWELSARLTARQLRVHAGLRAICSSPIYRWQPKMTISMAFDSDRLQQVPARLRRLELARQERHHTDEKEGLDESKDNKIAVFVSVWRIKAGVFSLHEVSIDHSFVSLFAGALGLDTDGTVWAVMVL